MVTLTHWEFFDGINPFGNLIKLISHVKLIRFNYMQ